MKLDMGGGGGRGVHFEIGIVYPSGGIKGNLALHYLVLFYMSHYYKNPVYIFPHCRVSI